MSKQKQKHKIKQKQKVTHKSTELLSQKGRLEITRSGMGFVIVDGDKNDIMVKPGDFDTALNGDIVRVKLVKENMRTGKK